MEKKFPNQRVLISERYTKATLGAESYKCNCFIFIIISTCLRTPVIGLYRAPPYGVDSSMGFIHFGICGWMASS